MGGDVKKRYAMVIDLKRCIGCHSCAVACKAENEVPLGAWRTHVKYMPDKKGNGQVTRRFLPNHCNQCNNPPCVAASGGSMEIRSDGITWVTGRNKQNLPSARDACPYSNISLVNGTFQKCHYCKHRLAEGRLPACVEGCVGKAKVFGDLNDPKSEVSRLLKKHKAVVLKKGAGTGPNTYYLNMEETVARWEERIPGFRQWSVEEIERDVHFNV